ncbi:hypothetical protein NC653_034904 [Populus alba x Populus x berolinensis]|uniref:Uncharacterized protein n=1 Tax=Populus alba x Populus x berolinensis TaxID=444605 RepID=A0AAD6LPS8_9ROSI|nr:hypothetical protein NC653_034904 [Populus alba x Populus x berolinensis]
MKPRSFIPDFFSYITYKHCEGVGNGYRLAASRDCVWRSNVNHTRLIEVKGGQIGCMRKISYNGSLVVALISSMEQLVNLSFLSLIHF